MGILQQIFPDQSLKIAFAHLLLQEREIIQGFQMQEGAVVLIEPAVEGLQAVHQARGIISKICLPVAELEIVDTGTQGFFVQSFLCQLP